MAHKLEQLSAQLQPSNGNHNDSSSPEQQQLKSQNPNSIPWNPNNESFPLRHELPKSIPYHPDAPKDAAWVWGENDEIGRLNLLTPQRVAHAAKTEIITGETVRLDLPLDVPSTPGFGRQSATHRLVDLGGGICFDDIIDNMNPQSGSQWDGFRHFAHLRSGLFYNGTKASDILNKEDEKLRCSVHHWSSTNSTSTPQRQQGSGISGRAILLDYWHYAQNTPGKSYDPYTGHAISLADLQACADSQGINILPASQGGDIQVGDMLLIRSGWVARYNSLNEEQRRKAALRHVHIFAPQNRPSSSSTEEGEGEGEIQEWAGLKQEQSILTWLHDCYFAAVAGDAPSFERWPSQAVQEDDQWLLHEYILALWGMPLGEMWNLERVAELCREKKRWTFFLVSAPDMVHGGVGSHPNATAIF